MLELFGKNFNRQAIRAIFEIQSIDNQNEILQRIYDSGVSGNTIGKALDVTNIYARIKAHRGRGPSSGLGD